MMALVSWLARQPFPTTLHSGASRSCQAASRGSCARTCSRKSKRPSGRSTRAASARACAGSGIVQRQQVKTTVQNSHSGKEADRRPPAGNPPRARRRLPCLCLFRAWRGLVPRRPLPGREASDSAGSSPPSQRQPPAPDPCCRRAPRREPCPGTVPLPCGRSRHKPRRSGGPTRGAGEWPLRQRGPARRLPALVALAT